MTPATKLGAGLALFTGRFGSGKTEASISYALSVAPQSDHGAILIDLDIVTPYFRSRESQQSLAVRGVTVIAPAAVGLHLDTPAISPTILGAIEQSHRPTVIDVGGDRQGARALGQFRHAIRERGYSMLFVVNPYRPFSESLPSLRVSIAEIEASSQLQVTGLVSNPNLMEETTAETILSGHAQVERYAKELHLPLAWLCMTRLWSERLGENGFAQPILLLDRSVRHPWESLTAASGAEPSKRAERNAT